MGPGMFDGLAALFKLMAVLLLVFLPLGLWKAIELIWWLWSHLHWSFS